MLHIHMADIACSCGMLTWTLWSRGVQMKGWSALARSLASISRWSSIHSTPCIRMCVVAVIPGKAQRACADPSAKCLQASMPGQIGSAAYLHVAVDLVAVVVPGEVEVCAAADKIHLVKIKVAQPHLAILLQQCIL